jgi:hypothetical protein
MDEPAAPFDLSREQQDTAALILRLLGRRIADRYVDFCRLAAGAVPLRVSSPLAAHALRELDSILRQALEVPMDVALEPSRQDIENLDKARAQLRALGYEDDKVSYAIKQLQPRLSHKEEIEKIVVRLGLAPDGDIARAWKSISQAHALAHGGRALHQTSEVDETFRAEWQAPFDTVMRGLMVALQGKYAAFMQRIDQLVAMPNRSVAVTTFSKEIPGALPLLWHFFNRLETPDWLPYLAKRKLLSAPPSRADTAQEDGSFLREWPAGRYLLRMAKSPDPGARSLVVNAVREVSASGHPDVQAVAIEILAALPAKEAGSLVDLAEGWLAGSSFVMALAPHDLIRNLAMAGEGEAALRVTRAVFRVFSENGRLATLFSQHMYEHHLPDAVKAIAPVCRVQAVKVLADLLDQALHCARRVTDVPASDYSYHISGGISEHGTKHDVMDALVGETVRAAKLAMESDPTCTPEVIACIRSHSPKLFTRIALHVLSFAPERAPDIAQSYLTDPDLLEESWCRTEYGELARAWFPSLPTSAQQAILACVDAAPDKYRERFNARFEEHEKRPPTVQEQRARDESIVRDLVWHWRDVLPTARREAAETLGDPDAWLRRLDAPVEGPSTAPDLSTSSLDEIVVFLKTWRPTAEDRRETTTALGQALRAAAMANPQRYSAGAPLFAHLPAIYVRRLLEGLAFASNNKNELEWKGALELMASILDAEHTSVASGMTGDDPDWSWTRKAIMDLLASGLRRGAEGPAFTNGERVQAMILDLYQRASRTPDTDNFEESYRQYPHFGAQSTSRGAAVELCLLLMFWLSKDEQSEFGKAPREALSKLPAIRQVLEAELGDRSASGRIPRAILGRYLTWLQFFGQEWLAQHLPLLFPDDDLPLRDAAWYGHLGGDSGPISVLATRMQDCYATEIGRLRDQTDGQDRHADNRFPEYLVILYIHAALPNEIFEEFWNTAPVRHRQHAMWFLGVQLEFPPEKLPEPFRTKAISYWERRLAAARTSSSPDHFREEIGAIGQFFFRKGIPDAWLLEQVIAASEAGFAPGEPYSVVNRLAQTSSRLPDQTAQALTSLVKNRHFNHWTYMTQGAEVRTIFVNGLAAGDTETATAVVEAINYLAAMGDTRFIDLIPHPGLNKA